MRRFLPLLLIVAPLFGCDDDTKPSEHAALSQIEESVEADIGDAVTFDDFKYENGYAQDENNYVVSASYTAHLNISAEKLQRAIHTEQLQQSMTQDGSDNAQDDLDKAQKWVQENARSLVVLSLFGEAKAGDTVDVKNSYLFRKTEKGWMLQGLAP